MSFKKDWLRSVLVAGLGMFVLTAGSGPAWSVKLTKFTSGPVVVRLCPVKCVEVSGHGFRKGKSVAVFETQGGWSRVSAYLDTEKMRKSFGNRLPDKPAYWVPSKLIGNGSVAAEPAADVVDTNETMASTSEDASKKMEPKEVVKAPKDKQKRQKRRVTLPKFRPGTEIQMASLSPSTEAESMNDAAQESQIAKDAEAIKKDVGETAAKMKPKKPARLKKTEEMTASEPDAKKPMAEKQAMEQQDNKKTEPVAKKDAKKKVVYNIPKALEGEAKADVAEGKPVAKKVEDSTPEKPVKVAKLEPTFASTDLDPLVTEERPDNYIKAFDDKRLRKLPGRKSKLYKREEVIALRHHALMLLNNDECTGIIRGGRSATQKGMMYVVCTDDPTYVRQFSSEKESW